MQYAREITDKAGMDRALRKHQLLVGGVATASLENENTSKDGAGKPTMNNQAIAKTGTGLVWLMLGMTLACVVGPGCTYDQEQVKAFLLEPHQPTAVLEYRVFPPDVLSISSLHVAELDNRTERVRPDGMINLPLVGEILVAGKTPRQIEELLIEEAGKYYAEADATVQVREYHSQSYYVFGHVNRPGPLQWTGKDTVLDAIARTIPTVLAWPQRILLVRGSRPQEGGYFVESEDYKTSGIRPEPQDSPPNMLVINIMAMMEHGDLSNNVLLRPNDIIYVQPNPLARIGLALQQILFPVSQASEIIRQPGETALELGRARRTRP